MPPTLLTVLSIATNGRSYPNCDLAEQMLGRLTDATAGERQIAEAVIQLCREWIDQSYKLEGRDPAKVKAELVEAGLTAPPPQPTAPVPQPQKPEATRPLRSIVRCAANPGECVSMCGMNYGPVCPNEKCYEPAPPQADAAGTSVLDDPLAEARSIAWNDHDLCKLDDVQDFLDGMALDHDDSQHRETLRRVRSKLGRGDQS